MSSSLTSSTITVSQMKIDLCSDLHLEFADLALPGGDVLVVAGDLFEAKNLRRDRYEPDQDLVVFDFENPQKRSDRFYRFIAEECSAKYRETVLVMGNHEHYGFRLEKTADHIRSQLPGNVTLLENNKHVIDGVLFVGATMWTDLNRNDPVTHQVLANSMNDYRQITQHDRAKNAYYKLTTQRTLAEHRNSMRYFKQVLADNQAAAQLPVVMVTHHAPSTQSIKPRYQDDREMNGGYSSDLSEFILDHPEIAVWVHGHTHDRFCYRVGSTQVLCNPRGYDGYEACADQFRTRWFDVDPKTGLVDISDWEQS